jgi:hypothetical protein
MVSIRRFHDEDWPSVWPIVRATFEAGDTYERAVRLWRKLGFSVVGTLPRAFRHLHLGDVDAFVMFKELSRWETSFFKFPFSLSPPLPIIIVNFKNCSLLGLP